MIRITLLMFMVTCLHGCGGNNTVQISPYANIVAFGDSLTQGVGVDKSNSYPAKLASELGIEVINSGISGQTSSQGLARINNVLTTHMPSLIIICYGGNDVLQNKSKTQLEANLRQMIVRSKQHGAQVMLVAVPQFGLLLSPMPVYKKLADEYDLVLIEDTLPDLLGDASKKSDRVHLNAQGYALLASEIAKHIEITN